VLLNGASIAVTESMSVPSDQPPLTRVERLALAVGRATNESERAKRLQVAYLARITKTWVGPIVRRRTYVEGFDWIREAHPDRGVLQAGNHRSFFDQYLAMLVHYSVGVPWLERIYFPVRSNFFYEHPLGVAINLAIGAGTMYPPIFRDRAKTDLNKDSIERVIRFLRTPGSLVGVHPEGTRGKGPDPYELLPAQPGIGQMVLQAHPIVIPFFINGLSNDLVADVRANYRSDIRRTRPVIMVFGKPVDYADLAAPKPRAALYKRCADRVLDAIRALGERERELRAACLAGDIDDQDPGWLDNMVRAARGNGA